MPLAVLYEKQHRNRDQHDDRLQAHLAVAAYRTHFPLEHQIAGNKIGGTQQHQYYNDGFDMRVFPITDGFGAF